MNRLLVSLLAAVDALLAVAVGVGVVLAPVTLVWIFGIGGDADWAALWPAAATIWQLGHFAPVAVSLPTELVVSGGLPSGGAQFTLSLAPTTKPRTNGRRYSAAGLPRCCSRGWRWAWR